LVEQAAACDWATAAIRVPEVDRPLRILRAARRRNVVSGWKNKLESAIANVTPAALLAERHRRMIEAGAAKRG
jgi:hypothetical protein